MPILFSNSNSTTTPTLLLLLLLLYTSYHITITLLATIYYAASD